MRNNGKPGNFPRSMYLQEVLGLFPFVHGLQVSQLLCDYMILEWSRTRVLLVPSGWNNFSKRPAEKLASYSTILTSTSRNNNQVPIPNSRVYLPSASFSSPSPNYTVLARSSRSTILSQNSCLDHHTNNKKKYPSRARYILHNSNNSFIRERPRP